MNTVKVSLIALGSLALSSAAMAHGWDRGRREFRHEARYEERHEDRYAGRYGREERCAEPVRVVYVEPRPRVAIVEPRVVLQGRVAPGLRVGISFGL